MNFVFTATDISAESDRIGSLVAYISVWFCQRLKPNVCLEKKKKMESIWSDLDYNLPLDQLGIQLNSKLEVLKSSVIEPVCFASKFDRNCFN